MTRRTTGFVWTAAVALAGSIAVAGCTGDPATITDCVASDGVTPICGFQNPEDLAALPGGSWIAVSQYGGPDARPGSLVAYRIADGRKQALFPTERDRRVRSGEAWGDPDCKGLPDPEIFSPHGIDVDPARRRLAAVNHGGRESIELFHIARTRSGPSLEWRGCIVLPDGALPNDLVLLDDGGVIVTNMMSGSGFGRAIAGLRLVLGLNSGAVLEWHADSGWRELPGSEASGPNGIALSSDARQIYVAEWGAERLLRLRRRDDGSFQRDTVELPHRPDNITWTTDSHLLVTGQQGPIGGVLACGGVKSGTCALAFSVVIVEPTTLETRPVLEHPGVAMGAGTVALEVGHEVFIGTFAGDRLARAPFRTDRID